MSRYGYRCDKCNGTFEYLVRSKPFYCVEDGHALTFVREYGRPLGPAPTGCLRDEANKAKAKQTHHEFNARRFALRDYLTSFSLGRFDVAYTPAGAVVSVKVRMKATFSDEYLKWTASEREDFKRDSRVAIGSVWNRSAKFTLDHANWGPIVAWPEFDLEFVDADPQIDATIFKIEQPSKDKGIYDVSKNLLRGFPEHAYAPQRAQLTDIACQFVKKNPQGYERHNIIAHEFGHMIGLPDEYDDETNPGWARTRQKGNEQLQVKCGAAPPTVGYGHHTDSLMSDGTTMHPRFFVTVWEALGALTKDYVEPEEWVLSAA